MNENVFLNLFQKKPSKMPLKYLLNVQNEYRYQQPALRFDETWVCAKYQNHSDTHVLVQSS